MASLWDRVFNRRAISYQTIWGAGEDISLTSNAGTIVDSKTALQINAVYSAVSLISDTVSSLPVDVFVRRDGARYPFRPAPTWVYKPDVDTTKEAFWGAIIVSMLIDGNAYVRVFSNPQGEIVNMMVLSPLDVEPTRNGLGQLMFKVENENRLLSSEEVVFIPDVVRPGHIKGISRVDYLKNNLSLATALENYAARFFGQGTHTSGVIEFPGNLTAEQAKQLQDAFDSRHRGWQRAHKTAVLSAGAKYVPTTSENDKAQFIEARKFAVEEIARAFRVPPSMLAVEGSYTYSSVEQQNLAFVTHCLRPIIQKLESAFSPLMSRTQGGENAFIKFNIDGLLRADIENRMNAYSTGLQAGFLSVNDVRRLEDLRPIDDPSADQPRVPLANLNIDAAELVATDKRVSMASKLVLAGYDPAEVLQAMGLPEMAHTGVPSVQLQGLQNLNPEDPTSEYEV